ATGVIPSVPKIEGVEKALFASDVLNGSKTGEYVVVIGGGSIGCETAEFLSKQGKKVALIEMTDTFAGNTGKTAQTILLGHLKHAPIKLLKECTVERIKPKEVLYKDREGIISSLIADDVVLAVGNRPDTELYDELKDEVPEIYNIGDSNGGGIIPAAVYDGYTAGNKI
ncbi:MAG: FAD-dependent oxidoreductase, partial [Eubacterium sp.]|nr:FAD-dependent oxidoreductase [Eubacterium sp.]